LGEHYLRKVGVGGSSPLCSSPAIGGTGSWFVVYSSWKKYGIMSSSEKFNFENLRVYQDALDFSKQIYKVTKRFPKDELFALTSQFRRATSAVSLNIAEGGSIAKTEFKNFLRRSRGSVYECVPILSLALDNGYISEETRKKIYRDCQKLAKSISALIKSMK
jgi:four helix bundle protein